MLIIPRLCYNKVMTYDINPLDTNFVFQIGEPIMLILIIFTLVAGGLGFIGRVAHLTNLDIQAGKWLSRFAAITLYVGLFWIGLSMIISYFGTSVLDVINGAILITAAIVSLVKRAYSDQRSANHSLVLAYGFLGFIIIWGLIYGSVMHSLPKQFLDAIGNAINPEFFPALLRVWGWG